MAQFNQDDQRERAMVAALNLDQRPDRARHDEDAHLDYPAATGPVRLMFELKSAPVDGDFGTGRDTGIRQLTRWSTMHFVFAWFAPRDNQPQRIWYGSPAMMRAWNDQEKAYLAPDLLLTNQVPALVRDDLVVRVLGDKDVYSYDDIAGLMKAQWNADNSAGRPNLYLANADIHVAARARDCLYSRATALRAVRERVGYLLARGSTVNNRKIPRQYVIEHCAEVTGPRWAANLEAAIRNAPGAP